MFYSCNQTRPNGALDNTPAPARDPFPFVVALRDGFSAKAWGEAWECDLSSDVGIDSDSDDGARKMYITLVQDRDHEPIPVPPFNNPAPEQASSPRTTTERPTRGSRRRPPARLALESVILLTANR
ncbi:hypothetical protein V8E53_001636 [Lactarius tabidus]